MFRKMLLLRVGLPLPLAALERPVSHSSVSNTTFASGLNLHVYDFSRIPRRLMVSASTNPRLFGDARLSTAATTVFHGQWLVAWAVNPSPCTSQGLCAVSGRRLSADFRRRQHRLLARRPHRGAAGRVGRPSAWSTACWCHWWRPPSERITMGQKSSASFPPARVCLRKANAMSKTVNYEVDLGRSCRR